MKKKLWLILAAGLLTLPCVAPAGETDDVVLVDDVIITASRSEQANEKIAAQVTVITAEDIRATGAQSVPDALKNLGGVFVSDLNGNGFNQTVDMGGFGDTSARHVAVLVDGVKMNPIDISGISFISIPIDNVERIEVFHGGNSVLYGGDAMGGVVNIITQKAEDGVHGWMQGGIGSHETVKGAAGLSFISGKFGGKVGGSFYDTDGYRDRSNGSRESVDAALSFDPWDALGLTFSVDATTADYEYPGSLSLTQLNEDRKQAANLEDEGESREENYILSIKTDFNTFGRLDIDLSCRNYDRQDNMVSWNTPLWGYYGYYDYDYTTLGATPQYVLDHSIFGKQNRLTIGVEYYDTDYDAWNGDSTAPSPVYTYDHDQRSLGFYIQEEFSFMDQLVLNLGARYEDFDTRLTSSLDDDTDIDEDEWAWNLGLAYAFAPKSKVYARVYQAFRFPKVDEFMVLSTGDVNEDLTHETSRGYETGARYVGMDNRLRVDFRLFRFDVDDEIFWNDVAYMNENISETRHQGGEINLRFQVTDLFALFGGGGYTDAEVTSGSYQGNSLNGKQIPLVPKYKANLGVEFHFSFGLTARCQYNYLGERYGGTDYTNECEKLDSAGTVDFYLIYPYKKVEFFLSGTNIFDEEYNNGYRGTSYGYGYEYYYPMPEAVYFAGVRISF